MSERKVLNKYYPPDFDPSKIPRMKLPKNRQYTVRLMAPCNMRCKTCGEYIYKGKKFNARKEDVEGDDYLGIRIYRFYIKCTRCLQEISFKTDPKNTDYEIEAGATRNFMALKLAEEQAQREEDERKEEEATNPMKLLENRTKQSKQEIDLLESLEDLKDLNRRQQSIDYDNMLIHYNDKELLKKLAEKQEEEDEKMIREIYGPNKSNTSKRVIEEEIIEEVDGPSAPGSAIPESSNNKKLKISSSEFFEDFETPGVKSDKPLVSVKSTSSGSWSKSVGMMKGVTRKSALTGLVRKKPSTVSASSTESNNSVTKDISTPSVSKATNGLSLLGSYSDSDSNDDDSGK